MISVNKYVLETESLYIFKYGQVIKIVSAKCIECAGNGLY